LRQSGHWTNASIEFTPWLKPQPDLEHLDRIERELGIEAALDGVGLAEAVLLAGEQEIADGTALRRSTSTMDRRIPRNSRPASSPMSTNGLA